MPTAVIRDIPGNATALKTVLADIGARGITRIICLGDTVGYGPEPLECVDLVRARCAWSLMGNHDYKPSGAKVSSFHLLTHILETQFPEQVVVATDVTEFE